MVYLSAFWTQRKLRTTAKICRTISPTQRRERQRFSHWIRDAAFRNNPAFWEISPPQSNSRTRNNPRRSRVSQTTRFGVLKRDRKTSIILRYSRLVEAVLASNQNQQQTICVQNPPQPSDYQNAIVKLENKINCWFNKKHTRVNNLSIAQSSATILHPINPVIRFLSKQQTPVR